MCIIVAKPANATLSETTLFNMWMNNPHGAGLMYASGGRLVVLKGLMTFPQLLAAYRKASNQKMVMHFRWRTHGPVKGNLTHPFHVRSNVAFVHNGIIPNVKTKRRESDTSAYARVLQGRYPDPMAALENLDNRVDVLIEIGLSKLVFMDASSRIRIVNEQMGHWHDGCWYSNHSYTDHKAYDSTFGMLDYDPDNWKVSVKLFDF